MEGIMKDSSLHELVKEYRRSGIGRECIFPKVAELLYRDPGRFGFETDDDASEALFKYRRRIAGLADRYEDKGIPFDVYLASSLRYIAKTVKRARRRSAEREFVCEKAEATSFARVAMEPGLCDRIPSSGSMKVKPLPVFGSTDSNEAYRNRIVYLFLKCAWDVDDEDVARVSSATGVNEDWLSSAVAQSRRFLDSERLRFEVLATRRNSSWCRIRLLEARIREESDPLRRDRIQAARERERVRFERVRAEIFSFKPVVPNSVVARIIGIPKGTVDSGLYYLKKHPVSRTARSKETAGCKVL
jgi:hypothetical protein